MEKETHVASPEMKLFFGKLLELKAFVKRELETSCKQKSTKGCTSVPRGSHDLFAQQVYDQLDAIIKEKQ
jgi:hypothetical protein